MGNQGIKHQIIRTLDELSEEMLEDVLEYINELKPANSHPFMDVTVEEDSELSTNPDEDFDIESLSGSEERNTLTDKETSSIAQSLLTGMVCHYHKITGEIVDHPHPHNIFHDEELWQDILDRIENDKNNYISFDQMDSHRAYQVMEDFAHTVEDQDFRNRLLERLTMHKPFANFKSLVEFSEYREDWFEFRLKANMDWVRRQIE